MIPGVSQFGNVVNAVGGYVRNIGREMRDIPTAISTNAQIARYGGAEAMQGRKLDVAGGNNFKRQVKDVGGALLGKTGTPSAQYTPKSGFVSMPKSDVRSAVASKSKL